MTTSKELLTNNAAITISLASLTNGSYQQSAAIDNTTNLYVDAAVELVVKTGAASTSSTGTIGVYAYGSADGGSHYTDGCSGSNASFTPTSPTNLKLIGLINAVANATSYTGGPFSVASGFGYLPGKWGIVIVNNSGGTLDSTEGNHLKFFEGQQIQTA